MDSIQEFDVDGYGKCQVHITSSAIRCCYSNWDFQLATVKQADHVTFYNNNSEDDIGRAICPKLKGAKLLYAEEVPVWDEDPYGRQVQRGWVNAQKWDLSGVFKELEKANDMTKKNESAVAFFPLKQFDEMKKKHPDALLLFRVGDFYEMYKKDAIKASEVLGITLMNRKNGDKGSIELAGFPHRELDEYLPKLVRAGNRVAICEQLEDPKLKTKSAKRSTTESKKKSSEKSEKTLKTEDAVQQKTEKQSQQPKEPSGYTVRPPQMVTVNGDKISHGHAYQGHLNPQNWYFTAKLNGVQLKPQLMKEEDVVAYAKKELSVPQLMERYYPTKLMPRVPDVAYQVPNVLAGPEGNLTINKFNVYKETDETRADYGKYKFYAQVGDKKMSTTASREDLNAYFDRVATPGQLVERNFGERLHLQSHYEQFRLPEGIKPEDIRIAKSREGHWTVSVNLGEKGETSKAALSYDDGFSYFQAHSASREQLAAKYLGQELNQLLNNNQELKKENSIKR